ncbi:DUF1440 domain-containing protein [Pseudomonas sp. OIL-1]|uniref:DUF1440 domain-containing protein n=1 Tax=Pseudomonas sp. OIL-1 TaxID=2706126 RepID=UPI0013A73A23|nr:DUF1440 domain-containing protein [Pseudomonas sp. OIL-1]QIB50304.1 DUF1440 domain-containing protein [Pseudomonas sp. OIL-1]
MSFRNQSRSTNALAGAVAGAAAGALAVWVMDRVDWFAYNRESEQARQRTIAARPGGMDPGHVLASKVAGAVGKEITQPHPAGISAHYVFGMAPAAVYGALYDSVPALSAGKGTLFGLGMFLMHDEGLNALSGLSGKPQAYPWQAHARGFLAHLVYGVVLDIGVRQARKLLR